MAGTIYCLNLFKHFYPSLTFPKHIHFIEMDVVFLFYQLKTLLLLAPVLDLLGFELHLFLISGLYMKQSVYVLCSSCSSNGATRERRLPGQKRSTSASGTFRGSGTEVGLLSVVVAIDELRSYYYCEASCASKRKAEARSALPQII